VLNRCLLCAMVARLNRMLVHQVHMQICRCNGCGFLTQGGPYMRRQLLWLWVLLILPVVQQVDLCKAALYAALQR
jgi:hypothetical protein